uniref:Lipocalin n=1 Tax=Rhipicephalus zambeziensis TaxID=60191 RepID=A0A224YCA0_9ACAR
MYSAASVLVFGLFSCLQERSEGETLRRSTSAEVYDLKKFIEKNKKVWTYQSSDEGKWECKLDHLLNMRDNYASINRSYVMNKTVSSFVVKGRLVSSREHLNETYNRMILYYPSDDFYGYEDVLFENDKNTCAVIKVVVNYDYDYNDVSMPPATTTTWGYSKYTTWYEIRIPDAFLEQPVYDCNQRLKELANTTEPRVVSRGTNCRDYYKTTQISSTKEY